MYSIILHTIQFYYNTPTFASRYIKFSGKWGDSKVCRGVYIVTCRMKYWTVGNDQDQDNPTYFSAHVMYEESCMNGMHTCTHECVCNN